MEALSDSFVRMASDLCVLFRVIVMVEKFLPTKARTSGIFQSQQPRQTTLHWVLAWGAYVHNQ